MATVLQSIPNRRRHKRYLVSGIARIQTKDYQVLGRLVVVGGGGLLIYCDLRVPVGTEVSIRFSVSGFNEEHQTIKSRGRIAWSQPHKIGVEFLEEPPGLRMLLQLMEHKESRASIEIKNSMMELLPEARRPLQVKL